MNICKIFGCYSTVEGKTEMCATHNYEARKKARITVKGVAKKNRIKPVSDKQADRNEVYMGIRNMYLQLFPHCQVKGCRCEAQDLHHRAGRDNLNLFDVRQFMAVCRAHHNYIHSHPAEAYEAGYLLKRLTLEPHKI